MYKSFVLGYCCDTSAPPTPPPLVYKLNDDGTLAAFFNFGDAPATAPDYVDVTYTLTGSATGGAALTLPSSFDAANGILMPTENCVGFDWMASQVPDYGIPSYDQLKMGPALAWGDGSGPHAVSGEIAFDVSWHEVGSKVEIVVVGVGTVKTISCDGPFGGPHLSFTVSPAGKVYVSYNGINYGSVPGVTIPPGSYLFPYLQIADNVPALADIVVEHMLSLHAADFLDNPFPAGATDYLGVTISNGVPFRADPYWTSTTSLMDFADQNGLLNVYDQKNSNQFVVFNAPSGGGITGGRMVSDGTTGCIHTDDTPAVDLGAAEFTVDLKNVVLDDPSGGVQSWVSDYNTSNGWTIQVQASNLRFTPTGGSGTAVFPLPGTPSPGVAYGLIRFARILNAGDSNYYLHCAVDGTEVGTPVLMNADITGSTEPFVINGLPTSPTTFAQFLNGKTGGVRVTVGVARNLAESTNYFANGDGP